ncbi:MAG: UDP-4-amino-4,6-dideoxy-N-acetyl-beta-L-altrosamine transaminase [Gammaproteobacteria bacterium]|nr:UDP-4-amino-4,6-dideoxy-N-acetyl-beta-L-altrosamine transaminase [Gammaproteobacteria bacterium]
MYIPYGHQDITENDIAAVVDVLRSDWLTQGPAVEKFEKELSTYCKVPFAIAVANGTAALHLACLALDIGKNDTVWSTPNTFVASTNCALFCGAKIDFVDICTKTYNMSAKKLEEKLIAAKKTNSLPKAVIPVHFAGQSCNMKKIKSLADEYGFYIIEDACHALGGKYLGEPIGNCQYSDITVFSFHPVKIITTGEGGMITTTNEKLANKLLMLRTHGITKNADLMHNKNNGPWYYEQHDLGYNYRITDIQCALGYSQLKKLDEFVSKRHALVKTYNYALKDLPVITPYEEEHNYSAYHLYVIRLKLDQVTKTRKQIFSELRDAGIGVMVHYIPVHTQPYYENLGFHYGDFPEAEKYYEEAITLPLYPKLKDEQQKYIINKLSEIIR